MVQETGRRARNRVERHQAFLTIAKRIAFAEGLDALTMQRLARELDCAVGTAYTYFPSKSALVAEVQREAIEDLEASCRGFLDRLGSDDPLVRIVGLGRFWVDTFETFPEEARLMQLLMSESSPTVDDDDLSRVLPAAMRLLDHNRAAFDAAAEAGVLHPGDALERTVVMAAALNGVLQLDHVARVDPELFDGRRLAASLGADLLLAWGADPAVLAAAGAFVDALPGPLARPVSRGLNATLEGTK